MSKDHIDLDDAEQRSGGWQDDAQDQREKASDTHAPLIVWYGDAEPEPPKFLIRGLLPQTQTAIVSGQFSAGKTTICSDLSYSVMTGEPFAGHEIVRPGAVLWLGAEGQARSTSG